MRPLLSYLIPNLSSLIHFFTLRSALATLAKHGAGMGKGTWAQICADVPADDEFHPLYLCA